MNARYFQGATIEWIETLATLPNVVEIREEETFELEQERQLASTMINGTMSDIQWGVLRIGAPKLWELGIDGSGVVVGSIDSGVRVTHQSLRRRYRQAYGWFTTEERTPVPNDPYGHGTHTVGTMVGEGGIGVAPGAQWIACQACVKSCTESTMVQCAEWMLCPTDLSGQKRDCSKAPHVINNSWSGSPGNHRLDPILDAWVAAGIVPIFANANYGPTCGSVGYPGSLENVISVGNAASDGHLALSSSRGPSSSGGIKPDLCAPGERILSSSYVNNYDFRTLSGTSMAAPHVAGAVALLLSYKPDLSATEIRELLTSSANQARVTQSESSCSPVGVWPNNEFGHGLLDVYAAYETLVRQITGTPPSNGVCTWEQGVDLLGNDIGNVPSANSYQCCSLCFEFAGCRAFTWSNYNGGTCWFKDRYNGPRQSSSDVVSASVDRETSNLCQVLTNSDIVGNDLANVPAARAEMCCSLCAERRTQGCRAYTWTNYQGGTCWLKTARGTFTPSAGAISGEFGG